MRKSITYIVLWTLLFTLLGIAAPHPGAKSSDLKTVKVQAVASDDMEALQLLKSRSIHRAAVKRYREHQVHLEQLRASRAKERVAQAKPTNSVWDRIAGCESNGNWQDTTGFYEGGLQFDPRTWDAEKLSGYPDHAYQATREQQIAIAEKVLAKSSWKQQWPACSLMLGLRKE